ncbi:MAG: SUMF1/EgtB/PvdO family nonheme iron enzyme [Gammaproteobacteria bacterium]|nr:SUMF1/EgtB/PvdO family nonheme iron enzyme [Gammaproteobacteria bacterium]
MVVIPAGSYAMNGTRPITLSRSFAVGKTEVTFAQWDACVAAGGCTHKPDDRGWGRGSQPVMNVSWDDAKQYTAWLANKTSKAYRLLTEAEWEYAARAGTTTAYYWGDSDADICQYASVDKGGNACGAGRPGPVGARRANPFGLHDMLGSMWEWVEDCYASGVDTVPADGSARTGGDCSQRVLRGGSWLNLPNFARSADRFGYSVGIRSYDFGFRVARTN